MPINLCPTCGQQTPPPKEPKVVSLSETTEVDGVTFSTSDVDIAVRASKRVAAQWNVGPRKVRIEGKVLIDGKRIKFKRSLTSTSKP